VAEESEIERLRRQVDVVASEEGGEPGEPEFEDGFSGKTMAGGTFMLARRFELGD